MRQRRRRDARRYIEDAVPPPRPLIDGSGPSFAIEVGWFVCYQLVSISTTISLHFPFPDVSASAAEWLRARTGPSFFFFANSCGRVLSCCGGQLQPLGQHEC
jgi:hypothetical protein